MSPLTPSTTQNMVLVLSAVVLALTASLANAQQNSTYLTGLVQTLNNAGLTSLANAVGFVNSTGTGNQLLAALSNQGNNYTIFAPNDAACQSTSFRRTTPDSILTSTSSHRRTGWHQSRPQRFDEPRRVSRRVWSLPECDRLPQYHYRSYRSWRPFCRYARGEQEPSRGLGEA